MARSLSVKVPTAAVIAQIEQAIAKIDADVASYPADVEKYEAELATYKVDVAKAIIDYVSKNADKIGYDYNSDIRINTNYNGRLELNFDSDKIAGFPVKPVEPKKPNQSEWYGNKHINRREVLEQNLKVLRMTTQEEISASSYSSVIDLI
jgi:hypothetical protein